MPVTLSSAVAAYRATPISPVSLDFTVLSVSVAEPVLFVVPPAGKRREVWPRYGVSFGMSRVSV